MATTRTHPSTFSMTVLLLAGYQAGLRLRNLTLVRREWTELGDRQIAASRPLRFDGHARDAGAGVAVRQFGIANKLDPADDWRRRLYQAPRLQDRDAGHGVY